MEITENELMTLQDLRNAIKGQEGQLQAFGDESVTRERLNELARKFADIEVTEYNYKQLPAIAERELRETRYLLQKIQDNNNKFFNKEKAENKQLYESLILIIEPTEKQIKSKIAAIENAKQLEIERKKREEEERKAKIQYLIDGWETKLANLFSKCKTREDITAIESELGKLDETQGEFQEEQFQALRIIAKYSGMVKGVIKEIEEREQFEIEKAKLEAEQAKIKAEMEEQKKKEEEMAQKILDFRLSILEKKGFAKNGDNYIDEVGLSINISVVKSLTEIGWMSKLESIETDREKLIKENAEKKAREEEQNAKLKAEQEKAKAEFERQRQIEIQRIERVRVETAPIIQEMKSTFAELKDKAMSKEMGNDSIEILMKFFGKIENVINDFID